VIDLEGHRYTCHHKKDTSKSRGFSLIMAQVWMKGTRIIKLRYLCQVPVDSGHLEIVKLLLERGADVHAMNDKGETAYQVSMQRGHRKIADLLREHGACTARFEESSGSFYDPNAMSDSHFDFSP
jgi:hypothetical protein